MQDRSPAGHPTAADGEAGWRSPQWWPTMAGLAFAGFVAADLFGGEENGRDLAPVVVASGLVYLAAAALHKPPAAWPVFFLSVLVITAAKLGWIGWNATWVLLALAALLFAYGLLRGRSRQDLPLQTVAMVGFGAAAAIALYVNQTAGAYLVAAGLFAHAAWDVYHHWANRVVARSMAEFCCVLDVALAVAIVVTTLRG